MKAAAAPRVLLVGLDCAAPRFVFGPGAFDLPNLRKLIERGRHGLLRSCDPPITIPAWACMTTGLSPGALGIYGFRNRSEYSYADQGVVDANDVRAPRIWDVIGERGMKSVVLGVPQTYPPRSIDGWLVTDFAGAGRPEHYTHPPDLRTQLEDFEFDVADYRTHDKAALLARIERLRDNRFNAAHRLMDRDWQFFMLVELGLDRLHHGFWKFCDPLHPKFEAGNPYEDAFRRYYTALDEQIGRLIDSAGPDSAVMVVSDHGARALLGGFRVNEWLRQEGYLKLKQEPPPSPREFDSDLVDWPKTRAWAAGGYYGRIFLNVEGREPLGLVPRREVDRLRTEIIAKLTSVPKPDGAALHNKAYAPRELYATLRGIPPDILLYCGNLDCRAIGTLGGDGLFTTENDTGPDDANHDFEGILLMDDRRSNASKQIQGATIMDIAPTVLELLGVPIPGGIEGRSLLRA